MILPPPSDPFVWREFEGRPGLVCLPLEPLAQHLFTTAHWSLGARTSDAGQSAWDEVASAVGVPGDRLVRLRQVHGTRVIVGGVGAEAARPEADITVLHEAGWAAAVQAADCVPLLVVDRATGAAAAAHAGWRGMAARAPQAAVAALVREYGSRPGDLLAALGPSVGACCYEVGSDVRAAFASAGFGEPELRRWFTSRPVPSARNPPMASLARREARADRWFFDGWMAVRAQLEASGVPGGQIFGTGLCTASHGGVFCSYRRDGAPSGRIVGAIRCEPRRP